MVLTNCATGTLAPYVPSVSAPWDERRVQHLYRRLGFGAPPAVVAAGLAKSPTALVDQLIDAAVALPLPAEPEWAYWDVNDYTNFQEEIQPQLSSWAKGWVHDMLRHGPREKLALFWHNHFVTRFETYICPSYLYAYHTLLQRHALGNFRELVLEIGRTPAMLIFLNGIQNTRFKPNENYARELFELFTLGLNNGYTQQDIVQAARALTGYNGFTTLCAPVGFRADLHDAGQKTIFGVTGNFNYVGLIDLLFEQRAGEIARFICGKLYRHFVHPEEDETIVAGLAQTFIDNDFELEPVFRQLFRSAHFFDAEVINVQIKSPIELLTGFILDGGLPYTDQTLELVLYGAYNLGQFLFQPDDVAGWPGNRAWVDTNRLTGRWELMEGLIYLYFQNAPEALRSLAKTLSGNSISPEIVAQALLDHYLGRGLVDMAGYDLATDVFKWEVPQNYYDRGLWSLDWDTAPIQVALLLAHLARVPEFQLG